MADRTFPWGGGSSPMRRATELSGRRRHDQQRLLVELELDDSLYQGAIRAGMEHNALYPDGKRSSYGGDASHSRQGLPSYDQHFIAEPKPRLQSRTSRDTAGKPLTERQMQQLHAKRLSSPYKLKQQVLGTRNDPTHQHHRQQSSHNASGSSTQRVSRASSLQQSPAQLVIESVRQNIHLRDQVMAHLQQELMGVLPLHRASHVEKNVPQRVVKLLNRMRSLSLAVVEAVVYLCAELGDSNLAGTSVEHNILEQDFYGYLLQMASSDTDFLACSPALQRFFEDFEVNLTRNPFLDGLSLDSSEVLLCSCHQSASSGALFCSASSSSTSLLRLLTNKLETFALQTQRYLPGWQILPAERVAAAFLHLMDLETHGVNVELTQLVLPPSVLDTTAVPKSSSRSISSQRSATQKKSRATKEKCSILVDVGIQMTQRNTPTANTTQRSAVRPMHDEGIQVCGEMFTGDESGRRPSVPVVANLEMDASKSLELFEHVASARSDDLLVMNATEPEAFAFSPLVTPLMLPRYPFGGEPSALISGMGTPTTERQAAFSEADGEDERGTDVGYECDFEYSSNEALSSIAMALQMLPNFSLSTTGSTLAGQVLNPEEAIPPIIDSSRTEEDETSLTDSAIASATPSPVNLSPPSTGRSTLFEVGISLENVRSELERVEQRVEMAPPEDDEFAYSSSTARSNIAMALSLLPSVARDDIFSVPEEEVGHEPEVQMDMNSPRIITYRSSVSQREEPLQTSSVDEAPIEETMDQYSLSSARSYNPVETSSPPIFSLSASSRSYGPSLTSERTVNSSPVSSRSSTSASDHGVHFPPVSFRSQIPAVINNEVEYSVPASSRSNISGVTSYQADDESEPSEFNRIFALCRDIQVAAFDMSHWVSQREVEDHIQTFAQPFSSLMGYLSPAAANAKAENAPKYLERELKMLRRNFASWKSWVVDHKRAKLIVRRLVARRKVRQFVLYHQQRRVQARVDEESHRRFLAASRIQRHWRIYCHNRGVAERKGTFRVLHMAFHRGLFFVGISRRRGSREHAKEKVVRWWRYQRFRIKKQKQRQEKIARGREQRVRALRDIQKFLKEILLRRKLKAAQEMTKNILFKEQLKRTKAKRDVEKSMMLNSKHRRELIADMNARLADLDRRWKDAEEERQRLLTHHGRVVQQQQQAGEVRRRRLAALKIQMFFRMCLLHKKLQRVETEKKQYETKLQYELRTKKELDFENQQRIGKTRTQVRVLERKIGRMAQEALKTDTQHREVVQAHQERERASQARAARQKIKAFIDARTLCRRADRERQRLLLDQAQLQTEKSELELMSIEDQLEQRRTAQSIASDLQQRLSEMEARSEALLSATNRLAAEKEEDARLAVESLEHSRVEASMHQIASWVSGQMQLSKLKKEKAAVSASAAHELEEEKQKQRKAIEAKMREVTSIKTSSFMHQRISQHRNHKTVEVIRIQQQQKAAQEKAIAERTRAQLVQMIIAVKLLTEHESNIGIIQGSAGVAQFYKTQVHKVARLKHLRSMNCARKIQRVWRRWILQQRIKCAQELAFARLEKAKRLQASARRLQVWWRKWVQEQRRRREQQLVFDAHLEAIRVRANARKIQGVWRRWVKLNNERRREQQLVFEANLDAIRTRANVRKIQGVWRRWVRCENERRQQQGLAFEAHLDAIRLRANVRKIQGAWRRWVQRERERRHRQQVAFDRRLQAIRIRANVRKIQGVWRFWVKRENERRNREQLAFATHLERIRVRANVHKIQRVWRRWVQHERRRLQQLAFDEHLLAIRVRANVRKIQNAWRRWVQGERARRHVQQLMFKAQLEVIRIRANVRKIQVAWRCWVKRNQELEKRRRVHRMVFSSTLRVQRWWRKWRKKQRVKATRTRIMHNACAQVIQKKWRRWHRWQLAKRERRRLRIQREACARRLQNLWRQWCLWRRRREESAKRIQDRWEKWHNKKKEAERVRNAQMMAAIRIQRSWRQWQCKRQYEKEKDRKRRAKQAGSARIQSACCQWWERKQKERRAIRAVERIQRAWRRWRKRSLEKADRELQEKEEREVALKIKQNWAGKLSRRNKEQAERKRCLGAQRIQDKWRRRRRHEEAKRARKCAVEEQRLSAVLLQRAWKRWYLEQLESERQENERRTAAALVIQNQRRKIDQIEEQLEQEAEQSYREDERLQQEYATEALKIQVFWRKEQKQRVEQREIELIKQTQTASSLTIQRNWGIRQHRRKMERQRIQHDQNMAALKIQALWLKRHNEQQEELERERIRQEQDESSFKIERNWGMAQQRRKVSQERLRHTQNINALKIQKHWRRWWHLRLEERTQIREAEPRNPRNSLTTEAKPDPEQLERERERQQKLEVITRRCYGRCIARAVKRYHQDQREASAATKIEAVWKCKLYRMHYLQVLDAKHDEEARKYRLMISVLATKVQVCWRRWHSGVRQVKRALVKSDELRLIEEAKALERKLLAAKRALAAKRIQRALASRRSLIATKGISHREVVQKEAVVKHDELHDKVDEVEPVNQRQIEECASEFQEPGSDSHELMETPEEDLVRVTVEMTVEDWGHRQLPHILSRSVNQVLFCHEAASVLQKCVREYLRRQKMHFNFQRSFAATGKALNAERFHFYFKWASAWLDWDVSKSTSSAGVAAQTTSQNVPVLRLRIDSQMTRKLLQLFEPSEEYLAAEIEQVLQEIAADGLPILQSPVCLEDNDNPRPELRYHDVGEMELPRSIKLLRHMGLQRAQIRRQQLVEVDSSCDELPPSPVAKSVPSSPIGRSAPSSPSQRAKKEVTIFTAVENASVEDATFLQQRGVDLGALDPKTQRNALHMLSFSTESYRSRAKMLDFLLRCGANLSVNAVDCNGDTPLMLYASLGHLEFMQRLLQHGADIQMTNSRGQNVLHRACEEDQVEVCGFLQQLMTKDSVAENVVPVETIQLLAPAALSLHTRDSAGRYPLHCLAEKAFVECAKQLVVPTEANFEWNRLLLAQSDAEGRTALHLAVLTHDAAMTAFLLTPGGGSDVNAFDDLHRSPLHYAVESPAALPIISRLVQHGANLNVSDERGDTPLHWSAFSGRAAVMQNLLALGADPTLVNSDWETPAQIAAAYGQLDCMRLLLQAQRRYGAASPTEPRDQQQQQQVLKRPASEKTALQRREEAVTHLHQKQASAHALDQVTDLEALGTEDASEAVSVAEQAHRGYWEELHQHVQLVEESGQFSSEDEADLLFGHDDDASSF
ncbi:tRNA ligase [Phytophthora pseudosyringae]|uniref:tRNA ligase n=1 Tax=Phytophthora pseudosyringae TaxID=221518 RepID=A0A8T1W227_9STRA|nr:tRNA ligase [Phytophthora pseudosyringae]